MAVQQLSVKIGADVNQAVGGIKQVNAALTQTSGVVQKSKTNFTNLGRVIQDLPFGFIGIQNNLTQLIPSIGAIGLGISALTAAFSFAQIGLQNWSGLFPSANDKIKEQIKALHENQQALKDYVETLEDVTKARVQGNQAAQEELVNLKTLYDATQNANIPIAKRKQLVDELQDQYPKYFGNIKDEIILAGGAKEAYDKLSNSILASARARAAQDILVEIQKELLAVEEQRVTAQTNLNNAKLQEEKTVKRQFDLVTKSAGRESTAVIASDKIKDATGKTASAQSTLNSLLKQENELKQRSARLSGEIQNITQQNPDSLLNPTGNVDKVKTAKIKIEPFNFRHDLLGGLDVDKTITDLFEKLNKAIKEAEAPSEFRKSFDKKLQDSLKTPIPARINIAPVMTPETFSKAEKFGEEVASVLERSMEGAASALGEGIGNLFSGGGIEEAFKGVAAIMGDFISELGKMLIKEAIIIKSFKEVFKTILANPALALGVGIGMVALGQIIKNTALPKPKGFAEGGLAFGPTLGMVGEGRGTTRSNPEVIAPLDKLKKFIGGGQSFPDYLPAFQLSGDTLRVWYANANKSGRRHT